MIRLEMYTFYHRLYMVKRMYSEQWRTIPECFVIAHLLSVLDRSIGQVDVWGLLTAVSRVQLGVCLCFTFGVQSGTEEDFSPSTFGFHLPVIIQPKFSVL
jgi:hypothetical protein